MAKKMTKKAALKGHTEMGFAGAKFPKKHFGGKSKVKKLKK